MFTDMDMAQTCTGMHTKPLASHQRRSTTNGRRCIQDRTRSGRHNCEHSRKAMMKQCSLVVPTVFDSIAVPFLYITRLERMASTALSWLFGNNSQLKRIPILSKVFGSHLHFELRFWQPYNRMLGVYGSTSEEK